MNEITVPGWADKEADIVKEKRMARMILSLGAIEEPPLPFALSFDWGYRAWINPPAGAAELDMHRLLAWAVRSSAKKFTRNMRDTGSIFWWNSGSTDFTFEGETFQALIFLENFGAGKCKIIEEEKLVKVKRIVCDDKFDPSVVAP